jgi:AcrR family transcriptional regulator
VTPRGSSEDTRKTLVEAAQQVFLQRGFARATTREIARAAGVAEGTIYRHFADKQALFQAVLAERLTETATGLARFQGLAGQGTLRDNLAHLFEFVGALQQQLSALMSSMWADPELARGVRDRVAEGSPAGFVPPSPVRLVAEYLRREQALGRVRADVDAEEAAALVVSLPLAAGMERALSAQQLPDAPEFPAVEAFPRGAGGALDVLVRGLEAPARTPAAE